MIGPEKVEIIRQLYKQYNNYAQVGRILNIPKMTIMRIVKRDDNKDKAKRGPLGIITNRDTTIMKKTIRKYNDDKAKVTARIIQNDCNLDHVSRRTIQRHLKKIKFDYKPAKTIIKLSKKHKLARIEFVKKMAKENFDWNKVIFSDEKRFSLDGPDNWSTYTDENREIYKDKRQNKGGGIMVWAMLLSNGLFFMLFLDGNFDANAYCTQVLDVVKPLLDDVFEGENYYFQQDNAPIHTAKETREHLQSINMQTIQWPAKSPDLNIIENVWSWMVDYVYNKKCQYNNVKELTEAINDANEHINQERREDIKNLFKSILSRHMSVLEKKGDIIKY